MGVSLLSGYNGSSDYLYFFYRPISFSRIELLQFISHAFGTMMV